MIEIKNLSKSYHTADGDVEALRSVSLTIPDGDIFGIIGMSGAGKSTLVRTINMLERPTDGSVVVDGVDMSTLSDAELRKKRREITMIFQGFNLLMQRNCLENVCFPLKISGLAGEKKWREKRAMELLETVGLADKAKAYPAQLSGGQQQRVAIARALATNPKVLLCDEATSALDPTTTASILDLIRSINEKTGITVIIITHQMSVVESVCRHVAILDGGVIAETGEVGEIFSYPTTAAAKRLVFPEGDVIAASVVPGERTIRVVFNGSEATSTPLIAHMAVEEGIEANIAYASTRTLDGREYGSMLLGIRDGEEALRRAIDYLNAADGVMAGEVKF
ncbi:MAG: ATP-binding cassette domain-containing protein [Ruminococcaceae bacterium]|nr:ATP-binding cassette domain-containing protein [Oscillospiraceae bacterium]